MRHLDARQEGGSYRRIELITGERRRRRWTAEEKARIVAESFEEGANISEVARRNGVVRGLLTVWRHKFTTAAGVQVIELAIGRSAYSIGRVDRQTPVDPNHPRDGHRPHRPRAGRSWCGPSKTASRHRSVRVIGSRSPIYNPLQQASGEV